MKKIIILLTTILLVSCGKENEDNQFANALSEITAKTILNSKVGGGSTIHSTNQYGEKILIDDYVISENDQYVYTQVVYNQKGKKHRMINQYKKADLIKMLMTSAEEVKMGNKVNFISYDGNVLVFDIVGESDTEGCPVDVRLEVSAGNNYKLHMDKTYAVDCDGNVAHSNAVKQFARTFDILEGETLEEIEERKDNNYGVFEMIDGQLRRSAVSEEVKFDLNFDGKIGK